MPAPYVHEPGGGARSQAFLTLPPAPSITVACPKDCSGHGLCRLLAEVATTVPYPVSAWDSDHIQACVCDAGFFGTDCSQRSCATGDDPLTLCDSADKGMVQEIAVGLGSKLNHNVWATPPTSLAPGVPFTTGATQANEGMDLFGTGVFITDGVTDAVTFAELVAEASSAQLRVGATDVNGQVFYAPTSAKSAFSLVPLADGSDAGADSLKVALETIANQKVYEVDIAQEAVDYTSGLILEKRYLVTFVPSSSDPNVVDVQNIGVQNPLICDSGYGCSNAGCAPVVKMPFLYRYAAKDGFRSDFDTMPTDSGYNIWDDQVTYFTGEYNTDAAFNAKSFIRLDETSMPRMPLGVPVDSGLTDASPNRYDIRVVVAFQDPDDDTSSNTPVDVYWTKVLYGNTDITTDTYEYDTTTDPDCAGAAGVWSKADNAKCITGTLLGFTYRGFIPAGLTASIPDAPGIVLKFPSMDMVSSANKAMRFFEILVKLPSCVVTPLLTGSEFVAVDGTAIAPVSPNVENVECSNRGQCNRDSGLCECFAGFYGSSCSKQTTMV